ncbi:hypothetical protein [Proteiniclasticum sp. QWL-01]|uniref:hypothetical protein n=1 Tax=Proteiniclasticum sp. QWL-01 TaxID=3036945 RepID=UPI00240FAC82|nr:hypothetical protein [Proteiniclasticum sp. QWL-01]WFF72193.1 hypothetical protein P6M73_12995 [Proteiniclasticum sp. QWL-01]
MKKRWIAGMILLELSLHSVPVLAAGNQVQKVEMDMSGLDMCWMGGENDAYGTPEASSLYVRKAASGTWQLILNREYGSDDPQPGQYQFMATLPKNTLNLRKDYGKTLELNINLTGYAIFYPNEEPWPDDPKEEESGSKKLSDMTESDEKPPQEPFEPEPFPTSHRFRIHAEPFDAIRAMISMKASSGELKSRDKIRGKINSLQIQGAIDGDPFEAEGPLSLLLWRTKTIGSAEILPEDGNIKDIPDPSDPFKSGMKSQSEEQALPSSKQVPISSSHPASSAADSASSKELAGVSGQKSPSTDSSTGNATPDQSGIDSGETRKGKPETLPMTIIQLNVSGEEQLQGDGYDVNRWTSVSFTLENQLLEVQSDVKGTDPVTGWDVAEMFHGFISDCQWTPDEFSDGAFTIDVTVSGLMEKWSFDGKTGEEIVEVSETTRHYQIDCNLSETGTSQTISKVASKTYAMMAKETAQILQGDAVLRINGNAPIAGTGSARISAGVLRHFGNVP